PRECDQFGRVFAHGVGLAVAPPVFDADVLPDDPARVLETLRERSQASVTFCVVRGKWREHADPPQPFALLCARHQRTSRSCTAQQRDELASAHHSITSSARASNVGGMARPSAFAVWTLMANSNFTVCWTGKSPAFSPLRIRPA